MLTKVGMGRPSTLEDKRREFLPILAAAFAEFGFRRVTSAVIAERCGVRENVLYRIWPDKQAMFLATLEWVYDSSERTWERVLADSGDDRSPFLRLLEYEALHLGEEGLHRIVFAGLSETDDPKIKRALRSLYIRFQALVKRKLDEHRGGDPEHLLDSDLAAWAVLGLGTIANLGRELSLLDGQDRGELLSQAGRLLADAHCGPKARTQAKRAAPSARRGRR